jgi:hypothetical protein
MKIYHYTDKELKDNIISPKYFGYNSYTDRDRAISSINRSFWFTEDKAPEYRFINCKYKYKACIKNNDIYNLKKDPKKLLHLSIYRNNINRLLKQVKHLGYKGALYNIGYNVVVLFEDITTRKI